MGKITTGGRRRGLTAAGAVVLLVGLAGACASEADAGDYADLMTDAGDRDGPAGGQARTLAQASERSASEAYRVTVSMRMHVAVDGEPELALDAELASGEVDGDRFEMHMDLAEMTAGMGGDASGLPGADASLDMAGDREVAYLRASGFGALADEMGGNAPAALIAELDDLGDRWGRVELSEVEGLSPDDMPGVLGGTGAGSPQDTLAALAATEGAQAEDLGTDEIDGVTVHGTRFTLPFDELVGEGGAAGLPGAEGLDPGDLPAGEQEAFDDMLAAFLDADVPVEAWVDDDGYVRRIAYEFDMGALFAEQFGDLAEAAGETVPTMTMGSTMDFTDYGDPGIEIEFPDDADTVDITDTFAAIVEGD